MRTPIKSESRNPRTHKFSFIINPLLGGLTGVLLVGQPTAVLAQSGCWAITQLPMQNGQHPSINNSGEIVWALGGIYSSTRGGLAASGMFPHLANSGEVVYADTFEGPLWDLVSTTRGRLTQGGIIDLNLSDFGVQSSGEVVYAVRDTNSHAQVYSTIRGQITSGPTDHYNPCINDNGEIVWNELVPGVGVAVVSSTRGTLPVLPGMYGVGGCAVLGVNNHGDICFSGNLESSPGWYTYPHIFSSTHGAVVGDPAQYQWGGSINDAGTLVWYSYPYLYRAEWVVPPVLSIVQDALGLALEWSTNSSVFHVQYTTNAVPPLSWQPWTGAVATNGGCFDQSISSNLGSIALFRLSTVYYQKTRLPLKNCGSRGFPIVVVQHSAEFFSALDVTNLGQGRRGLDQLVLDPLMIAPLAIIVDEGRDGGPQMLLA